MSVPHKRMLLILSSAGLMLMVNAVMVTGGQGPLLGSSMQTDSQGDTAVDSSSAGASAEARPRFG